MDEIGMVGRNKVVVVTGGTQGIGRATAMAFAKAGYAVAVLGRSEARLRSTEKALAGVGVPALAISTDVSDAKAVDAAADQVERELGPISVWVNNAMTTVVTPIHETTPDEFRRVTEVTYLGQVFGTLAAMRYMRPRNRGHIIQVQSGLAFRSAPLQAAYCAAKCAIKGFTDSLRAELIHDKVKIDVTAVYLPAVNTPQFDFARNRMGRAQKAPDPVYDPRLCADAILAAAKSPVRDVWVGRSVLMLAALQAMSPAFADKKAAQMWEAQLRPEPPPHPDGNMFEAGSDDPAIDGPFSSRVLPTRSEFITSRTRDAASVAALGLLGIVALTSLPLRKMVGR